MFRKLRRTTANALFVIDFLWFCVKDAIKSEWDERRYIAVLRATNSGDPESLELLKMLAVCPDYDEDVALDDC